MAEPDEWDAKAKELLPCRPESGGYVCSQTAHSRSCPAYYRPAVAAEFRAQGQEIDKLNGIILARSVEWGRAMHEVAQLKAQNAEDLLRLTESVELGTKQAHEFDRQLAYERDRNANNVASADMQIAQLKALLAEVQKDG